MKKILTTILAAIMLVSNNGLQAGQQQNERPTPQVLVENSGEPIDTSAVLEQITTGIKIKPDTAEKKKNAENQAPGQADVPAAVTATQAPKEADTGYLVVKVSHSHPTCGHGHPASSYSRTDSDTGTACPYAGTSRTHSCPR